MKTFAQILNNKVHHIVQYDSLPEFASNIEFIDITTLNPQPKEGWIYNRDNTTFSNGVAERLIEDIAAQKIRVNQIASAKILTLNPDWTPENHAQKQRNALMRSLKLARKESRGAATAEEIAELDMMETLVNAIEGIRAASNTIIVELEALTTLEDVNSYNIEDNPLWPVI